ncbi:DJ-1/PfpI family protein [Caulobacter sp. FWC2]|uniref:DJ-1/PfpI family protein n=1 Tax=Caulobacter sp. FWC2 TaxID=69664 RepID=UPI000C156786|nr:DJ-1/PfpI family protein [Caulobacter sp. FWC2]PIB92578.1 thiamine biosynthesis protein ThiJ [Caulobacter sp. FWC2]
MPSSHPMLVAVASAAALAVLWPAGAQAGPLSLPAPKAGHAQRLVVIAAENAGAEITDFVAPYAVLKDSGLFEVRTVSTTSGPVQLRRAVRIVADQTLEGFDTTTPEGADIVIVPAQADPNDPALIAWVKAQAAKGATIVSICEGARLVAKAGVFDGRRAVTHWSAIKSLEKSSPTTTWLRDQRFVQDGPAISTTGVTASLPASMALIDAAGGTAAAELVAARLGLADWSSRHRTADFSLSPFDYVRAVGSLLAFWTHETVELPVIDGVDELGLALRADVWTRSLRARVKTTNASSKPIRSARGLTILVDAAPAAGSYVPPPGQVAPARAIDVALTEMGQRYGAYPVHMARMSMEYAGPASKP